MTRVTQECSGRGRRIAIRAYYMREGGRPTTVT